MPPRLNSKGGYSYVGNATTSIFCDAQPSVSFIPRDLTFTDGETAPHRRPLNKAKKVSKLLDDKIRSKSKHKYGDAGALTRIYPNYLSPLALDVLIELWANPAITYEGISMMFEEKHGATPRGVMACAAILRKKGLLQDDPSYKKGRNNHPSVSVAKKLTIKGMALVVCEVGDYHLTYEKFN